MNNIAFENKIRYQEAATALELALEMLQGMKNEHGHLDATAASYAHQVSEILSCDDGEAGLIPFVNKLD